MTILSCRDVQNLRKLICLDRSLRENIINFCGEETFSKFESDADALPEKTSEVKDPITIKHYHAVKNAASFDKAKVREVRLEPLTNIELSVESFSNLQKLVHKEANLKGLIGRQIGDDKIETFEALISSSLKTGAKYITENVTDNVILYHSIRNAALEYVLAKLGMVYQKMKINLEQESGDTKYCIAVERLRSLMTDDWDFKARKAEELGFDFEFIMTVLSYWRNKTSSPVK